MSEKLKKYIERNCHYCRHYDEAKDGGLIFPCLLGGGFGFTEDTDGKTWCIMKNKDPEEVVEDTTRRRKRKD